MMPKRIAAWLLCLSLLLPLPTLADAPFMGGGHTYIRSHTYTPAENTRYTVNTLRHTAAGAEEEHILSFLPNAGLLPVLVTSDSLYGGGITLKEAADKLRARGLDVVGGVNGSFFNSDMSPIGLQIRDGVLTSMGGSWQPAVGFTADGSAVFGSPGYGITVTGVNGSVKVDRLNQSRQNDQVFLYSRDFSTTTRTTLEGLHVVIAAEGKLIPGNSLYGKVTRVLSGKDPALIGVNEYVLSANTQSAIDRFSFLKEGDDVLLSVTCADARWVGVSAAVGGLQTLVKEGEVLPVEEASRAPRTAVGVTAEGEVLFYTVDGRQSGYSAGLTYKELALRMAELGCVDAFNLDGGGSTVMSVRMPGELSAKVVNKPSDGSPRRCADFILFCNVLPPSDGRAAHLFPTPAYVTMMPGSTADFSLLATDDAYRYVPLPPDPVTAFPYDGAFGITNGTSFTAALPGQTVLDFYAGNAFGSAQINITSVLDTITLTANEQPVSDLTLAPGEIVQLGASGSLNGLPVLSSARSFLWTVEGDIGSVSPDGLFTASLGMGVKGRIVVSGGGLTAEINVSINADPIIIEDFENGLGLLQAGSEGFSAGITQDAFIIERGRSAAEITYKIHDVWYTSVSALLEKELKSSPRTLSALVTGDGSGHELFAEIMTAEGQESRVFFGALDFTDARYLSAVLPANTLYIKKIGLVPVIGGVVNGTFYIHEIFAHWSEPILNEYPAIVIGVPVKNDSTLMFPLSVKDSTENLPKNVTVRWDGETLSEIKWEDGHAEIKVPLPKDGLHILSVDTEDEYGRRSRSVSAEDFGKTENPLHDVEDQWYAGYVNFLDRKGILDTDEIFGLRYFRPQNEATRLEVMTMIARALNLNLSSYGGITLPFADIGSLSEEELAVVKAIYAEGIISGKARDGALYIDPHSVMSHAEIFTILYNTLPQGYERDDLSFFADAGTVPAYARRATQTLVGMQVVRGSGGNLGFRSSMSRAEVASLVCRFFY